MLISAALRRYLPTFCWQTPFEVLLMIEQVAEQAEEKSIQALLEKMVHRGTAERRLQRTIGGRRRRKAGFEYRRLDRRDADIDRAQ